MYRLSMIKSFLLRLLSAASFFMRATNKFELVRIILSSSGITRLYQILSDESNFQAYVSFGKWPDSLHIPDSQSSGRAHLLIIDWDIPDETISAGDLTLVSYAGILRESGYQVGFLSISPDRDLAKAHSLRNSGHLVFKDSKKAIDWLSKGVAPVAVIARPLVARALLPALSGYKNISKLYYTVDLHFQRLMTQYLLTGAWRVRLESILTKRLEVKIFNSVDLVISPSHEESRVIAGLSATPVVTIPAFFFRPEEINSRIVDVLPTSARLLFVGNFAHTPNVDAAVYLAKEVMPQVLRRVPNAHLAIVGNRPTSEVRELAGPNVSILGRVEELNHVHSQSDVFVAPLRVGAGIKGKVIDAMRYGLPVVGSEVAWQGINIVDTPIKIPSLEPEAFATAIEELLTEPCLAKEYSIAGHQVIRDGFSKARADKFIQLLHRFRPSKQR